MLSHRDTKAQSLIEQNMPNYKGSRNNDWEAGARALSLDVPKLRGMSRQQRWQILQRARGRCGCCSKPRVHFRQLCDLCHLEFREAQRKRMGTERRLLGARSYQIGASA